MKYLFDSFYPNGAACVYGCDSNGCRVMIFKGYFDYKRNTVTLYPFSRLAPTSENVRKITIPMNQLKNR